MDYTAELRHAFSFCKREGNNVRVGPCPRKDICDGNKTLSVNIYGNKVPVGTFRCWQCGWSGPWNILAEKMRMRRVNTSNDLTTESERVLAYHNQSGTEYQRLPHEVVKPWRGDWRDIPEKLLKKLGAELWLDIRKVGKKHKSVKRLMFPVIMQKEEVGYIGAIIKKNKNEIKYKNSPGEWTSKSFFPFNYVKKLIKDRSIKIIILVEGPYDALRLLMNGIPALCVFGVKNWNSGKVPKLLSLNIDYVLTLGDNDKAGEDLNDIMEKDLEDSFEVLSYPYHSKDPGEMTEKEIKRLKKLIYSY